MDVGALVWIHDASDSLVWVSAQIVRVDATTATVQLLEPSTTTTTNRQIEISLSTSATGECTNVLLQNQSSEPLVDDHSDLVALPHLHEASILHALRHRYARDAIYTRIGEILISINPFKRLPTLYTREQVDAYAPDALSTNSSTTSTSSTGSSNGVSVRTNTTPSPPHLFAIARAAYVDVVRNARNQSILISGESGAGKTEATKIMMKYFAETCGTSTSTSSTTTSTTATHASIETQVLQSNPILEAFGNARTVRNDNSSRFGKFIELQFDRPTSSSSSSSAQRRHAIVGARIRTYLLEKIRVISQAPHERNFHVFYELIAAATSTTTSSTSSTSTSDSSLASIIARAAPAWKLSDGAASFRILSQSRCFTRRDGVQDDAQFTKTLKAMQQIGLDDDEIVNVLSVVAALLHMGNITFSQRQSASQNVHEAVISAGNAPFGTACALLRVAPEQLAFALTKRTLTTATESITVALDAAQAEHTRNALVMESYRLLFAWLVGKINSKIHFGGSCGSQSQTQSPIDCIGLLDIFGFEDMAVNSFEQLCINYANEALQHQFNGFVFDMEQKLYKDEELTWTFVDFPNNSACLELFERKPMGLFALCDQECLFPQGTDRALLAKLYAEFDNKKIQQQQQPKSHAHFLPPSSGWQRGSHFVVAHYAGKVSYAVDGFLNKNKDSFCETAVTLLATSSHALVQSLSRSHATSSSSSSSSSTPLPAATADGAAGGARKTTKSTLQAVSVGSQFKLQLNDLLELIRRTAPHYVRCIKPNDTNTSDTFHAPRVVEQLRSGGVLEAVRVARDGFPVRMSHSQFLERYRTVLLFQATPSSRVVATAPGSREQLFLQRCLTRLSSVVASAETGVCLGKTRVFFRRQPYEQLEQFRATATTNAAVWIQKTLRGYGARHRFQRLRQAVLRLQSLFRGSKARAYVTFLRHTASATLVQRHVRRWLTQQRFLRLRASVVACQCHFRRRQATQKVQQLRETRAATRLVSFWRCHSQRRRFSGVQRMTLALQCAVRRRRATKTLLALRLESRNVSKLQQDNLQLQAELAMLRMQLLTIQTTSAAGGGTSGGGSSHVHVQRSPVQAAECQWKEQRYADNNQRVVLLANDPSSLKSSSLAPLAVDLSCDRSPHKVTLVAPHSVAPPTAPGRRRSSGSLSEFCGSTTAAASMTKAELFTQAPPRDRSRSSQQLRSRHYDDDQQRDALDAKVKLLREQLREAAKASDPEQEQEQIVKRFVSSQLSGMHRGHHHALRRTPSSTSSSTPLATSRLQQRHSGSFGLELPEDCDNNSIVDEEHDEDHDHDQDDAEECEKHERPVPVPVPAATRPAPLQQPPQTACAPHSRFVWSTTSSTSSNSTTTTAASHVQAPRTGLSRPAQIKSYPRFFGDLGISGLAAFDLHAYDAGSVSQSSRSSVFSGGGASSVTNGSSVVGGIPSSVPRWCKDVVCRACQCKFTFLTRRHHCRSCGNSYCFEHSTRRLLLPELGYSTGEPQRVCDDCFEWRVSAAAAMRDSHASSDGSGRMAELLTRSESLASVAAETEESYNQQHQQQQPPPPTTVMA